MHFTYPNYWTICKLDNVPGSLHNWSNLIWILSIPGSRKIGIRMTLAPILSIWCKNKPLYFVFFKYHPILLTASLWDFFDLCYTFNIDAQKNNIRSSCSIKIIHLINHWTILPFLFLPYPSSYFVKTKFSGLSCILIHHKSLNCLIFCE